MSEAETLHVQVPVTGMNCASCVSHVEKALAKVAGVRSVSVNLASEKADVDAAPELAVAALAAAVTDAGYGVRSEKFELAISGMQCASCVGHVEKALSQLPGVLSATVNLASEKAYVEALAGNLTTQQLVQAVKDAGYRATPVSAEQEDDSERRGKNNAS